MLYNPKQGEYPFTLSVLISWLEKQPASKTYQYEDRRSCLLGQYLTSLGYKNVQVGPVTWRHGEKPFVGYLPREWEHIALAGRPDRPFASRTFGDALRRARELARA